MIYTVKPANYPEAILLTWRGLILMAPPWFDSFIGKDICFFTYWCERHQVTWKVKE